MELKLAIFQVQWTFSDTNSEHCAWTIIVLLMLYKVVDHIANIIDQDQTASLESNRPSFRTSDAVFALDNTVVWGPVTGSIRIS